MIENQLRKAALRALLRSRNEAGQTNLNFNNAMIERFILQYVCKYDIEPLSIARKHVID